MKVFWKSDIGKVRQRNEDFILVDRDRGIFLLADGMGGLPGGDVASSLAVSSAHKLLAARLGTTEEGGLAQLVADALALAHAAVSRRGVEKPEISGMGATLDILCLREKSAWISHVGDSRVYHLRQEELRQVTTDDNLASALALKGAAPEEIPPGARHMLTQAIGSSQGVVPQIHHLDLEDGDLVLMCSDGLTAMVPDNIIAQYMTEYRYDTEGCAYRLVADALARGGYDNVSVIIIAI